MFNPKEHMIQLKGKEYLQVMWRLVWFREDCPLWNIETTLVSLDEDKGKAVFKCVISDENGMPKSSGYGSECIKDFGDYLEKAETKAVGRALAMLGYGTQFAPELDEGDRIVDSPVGKNVPNQPMTYEAALDLELNFGQYKGDKLRDIWKKDFDYIKWLAEGESTSANIKEAISIIYAEIQKAKAEKQ